MNELLVMAKKKVSYRLDENCLEAIARIATKDDRSDNYVVNALLTDALKSLGYLDKEGNLTERDKEYSRKDGAN
ncbi:MULTISPECIES: hypothetical protein [Leptolyngbya]|uniref:hypothetical protein n=1 Tax=Leptolyngbya TaxID=47251 RepID=UPI001684542A|nr:hypothetical protein [Leptolyngbya sp. FACHB-1624]MBD1856578.1 hypothetical protein [Leptolyngbya sp. FACHB-1624]